MTKKNISGQNPPKHIPHAPKMVCNMFHECDLSNDMCSDNHFFHSSDLVFCISFSANLWSKKKKKKNGLNALSISTRLCSFIHLFQTELKCCLESAYDVHMTAQMDLNKTRSEVILTCSSSNAVKCYFRFIKPALFSPHWQLNFDTLRSKIKLFVQIGSFCTSAWVSNRPSTLPADPPQGELLTEMEDRRRLWLYRQSPYNITSLPPATHTHTHTHTHTPPSLPPPPPPTPFLEYTDPCEKFPVWARAAELHRNNIGSLKVLQGETVRISVGLWGINR